MAPSDTSILKSDPGAREGGGGRLKLGTGHGPRFDQTGRTVDDKPPMPKSIPETGLTLNLLMTLMLKSMHVVGLETASLLGKELKLFPNIVAALLRHALERGMVESLGASGNKLTGEVRYSLTSKGREWVNAALDQSQYVGPAPVTLASFQEQIHRQSVTNERIDNAALTRTFANLVLSAELIHQLGPAVNSGAAMLLYGPAGNGKTSVAVALADAFQQTIYVPYCVEVDGQIIKVFDPTVHIPAEADREAVGRLSARISDDQCDQRWVRCHRPVVVTGGELTLEMLDLSFNGTSKFYEAPLQIKATNGIFILDDFGRQIVRPKDILNRWIIPLEHGIDYLTLHTGKKFPVPFDELVIFSTNIPPREMMDPAMMRRIPYKLAIDAPSKSDYKRIFENACQNYGIELSEDILSLLLFEFYVKNNLPLARYHPRFIVEHVMARCRYEGIAPKLEPSLVMDAAQHLYTSE